nr:tetratricopeptide repeat protein [Catenibacterium mitsuokai]
MNKKLINRLLRQAEKAKNTGNYIEEIDAYQKLYDLYKHELGEKHPDTLYTLLNIAGIYSNLGCYNKALELTNSVYDAMKEIFGENHPDTITTFANLANTYNNLGDYYKALELENIVYNERKDNLGDNHPETLRSLANLASTYSDLGDYSKALELKNIVYNARKEILGDNHPETLRSLANLAISYSDIGEYSKACELQRIVCNERKEILGGNHPETLRSLANLANLYSDLGDYSKALELHNTVYTARKEILGENHPDTLTALANLAASYSHIGNYNKALELTNIVYHGLKEIFGETHPKTIDALENIANTYNNLGFYNKALELENTVYNARKDFFGESYPDTINTLSDRAVYYNALGDYNKALELQNRAYNIQRETLGENHPDVLRKLTNLAYSYSNIGDYYEAVKLGRRAYNSMRNILGENHPNTIDTLSDLAFFYNTLGDYNKALELQNRVYNARKEILGENHPTTLNALSNLANCYSMLNDYDKALEIGTVAYESMDEALGPNHPSTLTTLNTLLSIQIFQEKNNDKNYEKNLIKYFENIKNLNMTVFNIQKVYSMRQFLKKFHEIYEILKMCIFERNSSNLLDYLFANKNLSFKIDVNIFLNKSINDTVSLEEVIQTIGDHLIIDFYELDNSKYGLLIIKKGKYSKYVVGYEDIINGSFIDNEDIKRFIGSFDDYDHVYICPDGKIYDLSFERILRSLNISYLSSVQTLFQKNDDDNTHKLISFVSPDFSGKLSDDTDRGDKKGALYGSYLEGMFIHEIYGKESIIYNLNDANRNNFLKTKNPRIFHVSTHGDYLDNEYMDPMERGILYLSGCNIEKNNFGYVSAKEIQYMDLKGTELAVLSACNTGLGVSIRGEGMYGIRRAFELAGCDVLILTVEEVDDYNSAIFVKSFYERYNQTNNIYQSFKDTKEYLKEYGLVELKELRDVFEKEMKNEIKNQIVYTRNLKELNNRIEESKTRRQIVRKKNGKYVVEDWNGFIIQGKIEN